MGLDGATGAELSVVADGAAHTACVAAAKQKNASAQDACFATVVLLHIHSSHEEQLTIGCHSEKERHKGQPKKPKKDRKATMQWFQKSLPALRERFLRQFPYPVTFFYSPLPGVERDIAEVWATNQQ